MEQNKRCANIRRNLAKSLPASEPALVAYVDLAAVGYYYYSKDSSERELLMAKRPIFLVVQMPIVQK